MTDNRPTICKVCGDPFHVDAIGRTREFCSNACRQYHYRKNRLSFRQWLGRVLGLPKRDSGDG